MRKRIWMLTLVIALLIPLNAAAAQGGDPCADAGGTLDPASGECTIIAGISLEIAYPVELASDSNLLFRAQDFLDGLKTDFVLDFAMYGLDFPSPGPWALNVGYTIYTHEDFSTSIVFSIYEYTGGANGNTRWEAYTHSAGDETPLSLADLFEPGSNPYATLAAVVPAAIQAKYGDMVDMDWVLDGTGEDPFNYQHFALTPTAVIFYFDEYQVGPGAMGAVEVEIPLSDLSAVLVPELRP